MPLTETNQTTSRVNLWGNGLVMSGGETLLPDGVGATRGTTNSGQGIQSASAYTAFGLQILSSGSTASAYRWGAGSGYRSDGFGPTYAAPLMKVGARYYDPEFGGFLTRDTDLSQSPYVYCCGDPVNFSDPSGHLPMQGMPQPNGGPGGPSSDGSGDGSGDGGNGGGDGSGNGLGGGPGGNDPGGSSPGGGSGGSAGSTTIPTGDGTTLTLVPAPNGGIKITANNGGPVSATAGFNNNFELTTLSEGVKLPVGSGFFVTASGGGNVQTGSGFWNLGAGFFANF